MRFIVNLLVLFLIFQAAAGFFKITIPRYRTVTAKLQERNKVSQEFDQIKTMGNFFNSLMQRPDFQALNLSKRYFEIYLPSKFYDFELMAIINSLLRQNNFSLRDLNFAEGATLDVFGLNLPNIKEINFNLTLEGRYDQIISLVKDLEQHSRIFKIRQIRMDRGKGGQLTANIQVTAYYLKPVDFP